MWGWVETTFDQEPISAVKMILASHSTGQLILHVSDGTVRAVVWREKIHPAQKVVDIANGKDEIMR